MSSLPSIHYERAYCTKCGQRGFLLRQTPEADLYGEDLYDDRMFMRCEHCDKTFCESCMDLHEEKVYAEVCSEIELQRKTKK